MCLHPQPQLEQNAYVLIRYQSADMSRDTLEKTGKCDSLSYRPFSLALCTLTQLVELKPQQGEGFPHMSLNNL